MLDVLAPLIPTTVSLSAGYSTVTSLGMIVASEHSYWTERIVTFSFVSAADLLAQLADAGVPEGAPEYRAAFAIAAQTPRPSTIYFGRKDAGDPGWATALNAMRAASSDWWGGVLVVRVKAEIQEVADWQVLQSAGGWIFMSADADVYNEASGNVAEYIYNLSKLVGTVLYHDPATASDAAAPYADTSAGPWDLTPGGTLSSTCDAEAPEPFVLAAGQAVLTSTNAGPYVGANGQNLVGSVDGVAFDVTLSATPAQYATLTPGNWDFTTANGNPIYVETDTGTENYNLGSGAAFGNPGDVSAAELVADFTAGITAATATATDSGGGVVTFASATSGTNGRFRFAAGTDPDFLAATGMVAGVWYSGTGNVPDVGAYTAAQLGGLIQSDIGLAGTAGAEGTGKLEIASGIYGTSADVTITSGTAGLLAAVGISAGSTPGTGDVGNAASVEPLELHPLLDAAYTDASVTLIESNTKIRIANTLGIGRWHTLRLLGELRSELGLTSGLLRGAGTEDDHADAAWLGQIMGRDLDTPPPIGGLINADNRALVGCYGDRYDTPAARAREISLRENAAVSTLRQWTTYRAGPEVHDGRATGDLDGQPVYFEILLARDWLALRCQQAFKRGLDNASDANRPIPFTTNAVRTAVLGWLAPVLQLAVRTGVLAAADLTPPDPSKGKVTGVTVLAIEESSTLDRSLRRARVFIKQQLAGALQRGYLEIELINA